MEEKNINPSQIGYELEELIHNELIRFSGVNCYRENDIKNEFKDPTLNGIDHWVKKGNTNIFIQDKWKNSVTQPEISQFLVCVERLKNLIISSESSPQTFYMVWISKIEPTSFGLKLLNEKNAIIIINSTSIQSLSREVYWRIGDLLDSITNGQIDEQKIIDKQIKQKIYDETEEGLSVYNELVVIQEDIHKIFEKVIWVINSCGGEVRIATIDLFPNSIENWKDFKKKIDYNKFLSIVKKMCVATKSKRVMCYLVEYYTKLRSLSVKLSQHINRYTQLVDILVDNKSLKVKSFPMLKCLAEPMTYCEFEKIIKNSNGYYKGMESNFGVYYNM